MNEPCTRLPVWATAIESWRFLLHRPAAALLTLIISALWLNAVRGISAQLAIVVSPTVTDANVDSYEVNVIPFAIFSVSELLGAILLAAVILVLWQRAGIGERGDLRRWGVAATTRAVGKSALLFFPLFLLWFATQELLLVLLGFQPALGFKVHVEVVPLEMIPTEDEASWTWDPRSLVFWAAYIIAVYLPVRLALQLPAVAAQRRIDVRKAWLHSRGNGWRLVFICLLALVPVWLANSLVEPPFALPSDRDWLWLVRRELDRSFNGLYFAMAGIVFALAYKTLGGMQQSGQPAKSGSE